MLEPLIASLLLLRCSLLLAIILCISDISDSGDTYQPARNLRSSFPSGFTSYKNNNKKLGAGDSSYFDDPRPDIFSGVNFRILEPAPEMSQNPFVEPISLNTTVYLGQTASLPCVVKHLGDKTISWIRGKDLHILTSGVHTYTNDHRVILSHHEGKSRHLWTLNIKNIEKSDEGIYECQLNTEPKLTSTHHLHVLNENVAEILGPSTIHQKKGDTVIITCLISNTRLTTNVSWFLNDFPIERSSATHGRIQLDTKVYTYRVESKLIIHHVFKRDEGKYSCGGLNVFPASVLLIVHDDSHYDGNAGGFKSSRARTISGTCWGALDFKRLHLPCIFVVFCFFSKAT